MRAATHLTLLKLCSIFLCFSPTFAVAQTCATPDGSLGVARIVEIDTRAGPLYGAISRFEKEDRFLKNKEVLLTFDDGPSPKITQSILDTLDKFCTKATFFPVGRMALAYPESIKEILRRGHSLGGHTWSHPLNLRRLKKQSAIEQIEDGFAALALASGNAVSAFFRFPGLSDSNPLLHYLQKRGVATFTVDVVTNDSFIRSSRRLVQVTMQRIKEQNGGIILFHDIKRATAKALPTILRKLKNQGYKVVHVRSKRTLSALPDAHEQMAKRFEARHRKKRKKANLSLPYDDRGIRSRFMANAQLKGTPIETLSPTPKERGVMSAKTTPLPVRKPKQAELAE